MAMSTTANEIIHVVADVSADTLLEYTRNIAEWVRLSGSEDEQKAFDYIDQTLTSWGLTAESFHPVCLVSLPVAASLTVSGSGEAMRCITHSFSAETGPDGVAGDLVDAGHGDAAAYDGLDVVGKVVLVDGPASPGKALAAEGRGAVAVVHISPGEQIREMIVSPVWGTPTPETFALLPTLPHVSVNGASGRDLRERMANGPVRVRITTEVDTGWRPLPVLVTTVPARNDSDDFVLLSGHVDSWHYGAIDNGTADASMLETTRILLQHRDQLRRPVRVAFWSGHSHARYGTSAWYVDEHWVELHDHCVAHVNIDGPGAKRATIVSEALTMAESHGLAHEVIAQIAGQDLRYRRMQRMGDQSLWGVGVPSLFVSISSPPEGDPMEWYHTPLDTMDVIDPDLLVRDAKILAATVYRLATDRVLPLNQTGAVDEIRQTLRDIIANSSDDVDLSDVQSDADALRCATRQLDQIDVATLTDEQAVTLNRTLMRISRLLMPVNYTTSGPFGQDLAIAIPPLPGLQIAVSIASLPDGAPERYMMATTLRRERNRVLHALREARTAIETALPELQTASL